MIPKVIHYCWFGGNPKSEIIEMCMASWKKHCPDWEIVEWNETNFDVNSMPYTKEAYEAKKWAFVSDVVRLYAIYEHGGVYMDTDVELLQEIDDFCNHDAWYAFETNLNINTGMGFGASKHHDSVKKMLDVYCDRYFIKNGKMDLSPCPRGNTEALKDRYPAFQRNGTPQEFDGVRVLSGAEYARLAKHYSTGTWGDGPNEKIKEFRDTKLKRVLRTPSVFTWIEKRLGRKIMGIYTFLVYDLLENGPMFYIKRQIRKRRKKR